MVDIINIASSRIFNHQDFDLNSSSFGSFDLNFWKWKLKDFEDATLLAAALPIIKLNKKKLLNIKDKNFFFLSIEKSIIRNFNSNGSFDQNYPNENHPTNGLDITELIYELILMRNNQQLKNIYKKTIDFAMLGEDYAIISNHLAHHAYEYLLAYKILKNNKYYDHAINLLIKIKDNMGIDGEFKEYISGDPGYQTRCIRYLVKCLKLLRNKDKQLCEDLISKSSIFINKTILPTGNIYSMFGSRNSSLIYFSGLEHLFSSTDLMPNFYFIKKHYDFSNFLSLDFTNFIRLFDDYTDCIEYRFKNHSKQKPRLNEFHLKSFGFLCKKISDTYIYIHYKFGGAFIIFNEKKGLVEENAGILLKTKTGYYGTRNLKFPHMVIKNNDSNLDITGKLFKSIQQNQNSITLLTLRLLNFTLLKFPFASSVFRKFISKRLFIGPSKVNKNLSHHRIFKFNESNLQIIDNISCDKEVLDAYFVPYLNLIHMASSKYFSIHKCKKIHNKMNNNKRIIYNKMNYKLI